MFYIITIWCYKVSKWFYVVKFAPILNIVSSISEIIMHPNCLNKLNLFLNSSISNLVPPSTACWQCWQLISYKMKCLINKKYEIILIGRSYLC